jgi:hypothetical protein
LPGQTQRRQPEETVIRSDAKPEAERTVTVIGKEPVVSGAEGQCRANLQGFMASRGDLEKDLLLALEKDLAVVDATGKKHEPIDIDYLLCAQTGGDGRPLGCASTRYCQFHSCDPQQRPTKTPGFIVTTRHNF